MNPVDDLIVPAVVKAVSHVSGFRRVATVDRLIARQGRDKPVAIPKRHAQGLRVEDTEVAGLRVITLAPQAVPEATEAVVYLHGGAYVLEISRPQWSLASFLARAVPTRVHVVLYPLAPVSTAASTVPVVADVLDALGANGGGVSAVGDSAGGGIAVAATQHLVRSGRRVPTRLVLLSPWLDASLTNADVAAVEPRDPMFTRRALGHAGRVYAGDLGIDHPLVSPINGALDGLPHVTIFAGTRDILWPDARDFAAATGSTLHQRDGALHDHLLMPGPMGQRDRELLRDLLSAPSRSATP